MGKLVDRSMLEAACPPGKLITLPQNALGIVTDPAARSILRDIGLPAIDWLDVTDELRAGQVSLSDDDLVTECAEFGFDAARWLCLGTISSDVVYLDVADGTVVSIPDGGIPARLNKNLETFVYFLYLLETERPNYDFEALVPDGTYRPGAEDRLRKLMFAADPMAFDPPDPDSEWEPGEPTWQLALRYVAEKLQ
ncbi:SUKH-4 family immunity protein [Nocardia sp. NPDC059240]|uniref:SUKH-4 family immunity protein n=1 Tax=Nocardia sp. NPDC059240 TaxID=3346786 RepID=UPI0036B6A416